MLFDSVKQESVDLYKFKIRNETDEGIVERVIQSQIKTLLLNKGFDHKAVNTIFFNKVIYFSAKQIHDKKNTDLLLSGGWYKYGPCYEKGRVGEGTRMFLDPLKPSKNITEEVESVFEEEFPIFMESMENQDQFFHSYLDHVYTTRQEHDEIKEFYINKNDLCFNAYNLAYGKNEVSTKQFRRNLINFEKSILKRDYCDFAKLEESDFANSQRLISLIGEALIKYVENKEELQDEFLESNIKSVAFMFDRFIQMPFADKNYIATFVTSSEKFRQLKETEMLNQYSKHTKFVDSKLDEAIEVLEPHKELLL